MFGFECGDDYIVATAPLHVSSIPTAWRAMDGIRERDRRQVAQRKGRRSPEKKTGVLGFAALARDGAKAGDGGGEP